MTTASKTTGKTAKNTKDGLKGHAASAAEKEEEIIEFGVIGKYENKNIFYNEGKEFGNYLNWNKINFSIHETFKPLTLSKVHKIINYKLMKMKEAKQTKDEED